MAWGYGIASASSAPDALLLLNAAWLHALGLDGGWWMLLGLFCML
jgi:hypothetical protein